MAALSKLSYGAGKHFAPQVSFGPSLTGLLSIAASVCILRLGLFVAVEFRNHAHGITERRRREYCTLLATGATSVLHK